ncbi:MAG TPA: hypothetical protein VE960_04200 [bacterium]|nr:hypothetical protein [bacterium]
MVSPFQLLPSGPDAAARVLRRGALSQVAGVFVLSVALFTKMPLILVVVIPLGGLLIALGFLAWLWAVIWAESG